LTVVKSHRLTAVKLYQKSVYKDKEKRHRVFDAKVSNSDDDDFFSEFKEKEKVSDEIAALFKKCHKALRASIASDSLACSLPPQLGYCSFPSPTWLNASYDAVA